MLSIPFQQTAAYFVFHKGDMEHWEHEVIDQTLDFDTILKRYDPDCSDPIKARFNRDADLVQYFKIWLIQGMRHPLTYLNAFISQTCGYWAVVGQPKYWIEYPSFQYSVLGKEMASKDAASDETSQPQPIADPFTSGAFSDARDKLAAVLQLCNVPFVGMLFQMGFYFWLMLLGVSYSLYIGRKDRIIILVPLFVLLLTCIAGPLNGSLRYGFPIIAVIPLVLSFCLQSNESANAIVDGYGRSASQLSE